MLPALLETFSDAAATAQVSLPLESPADLDSIDQIERAHPGSRLDQLAARTARQQIVRGDRDGARFLRAFAHSIVGYFLLDSRGGLLETLGARQRRRLR